MSEPVDHQAEPSPPGSANPERRHHLVTRLWHWLNVLVLTLMLMSGLMIFNAHPRLYWGQYGANFDHAWLDLSGGNGIPFPGWITIPSFYSLADARLWHFAFAWALAGASALYWAWSLLSGHARRDLAPRRAELAPAQLWHDVVSHLRLDLAGDGHSGYNTLQKLAYCGVLFGLLPLVILTGMTMSPALDTAFPVLVDVFGGRQSARSLHFIAAAGLVLFLVIHLAMLVLVGGHRELRAMITGRLPAPRRIKDQ